MACGVNFGRTLRDDLIFSQESVIRDKTNVTGIAQQVSSVSNTFMQVPSDSSYSEYQGPHAMNSQRNKSNVSSRLRCKRAKEEICTSLMG